MTLSARHMEHLLVIEPGTMNASIARTSLKDEQYNILILKGKRSNNEYEEHLQILKAATDIVQTYILSAGCKN